MSPRTGRPVKDESEKKSVRLEIRLTDAEAVLLSELSQKLGLSKTDTILQALHILAEQK